MIETVMIVCICLFIARAAELDGDSSYLWGGITLALCVLSMAIDLPGVRILLAGLVAFAVKFAYNLAKKPI
jgi:hypothetical protein